MPANVTQELDLIVQHGSPVQEEEIGQFVPWAIPQRRGGISGAKSWKGGPFMSAPNGARPRTQEARLYSPGPPAGAMSP